MTIKIQDVFEKVKDETGLNEVIALSDSVKESALTDLAFIESTLGDDTDTFLENMLNTDEDAIKVLTMMSIRENTPINEVIVKRVDSKGTITKVKDRKTRQRLATQTTGLSKSKRTLIARKAAKTKRANPAGKRRALRKRKRAMARRKIMGL